MVCQIELTTVQMVKNRNRPDGTRSPVSSSNLGYESWKFFKAKLNAPTQTSRLRPIIGAQAELGLNAIIKKKDKMLKCAKLLPTKEIRRRNSKRDQFFVLSQRTCVLRRKERGVSMGAATKLRKAHFYGRTLKFELCLICRSWVSWTLKGTLDCVSGHSRKRDSKRF